METKVTHACVLTLSSIPIFIPIPIFFPISIFICLTVFVRPFFPCPYLLCSRRVSYSSFLFSFLPLLCLISLCLSSCPSLFPSVLHFYRTPSPSFSLLFTSHALEERRWFGSVCTRPSIFLRELYFPAFSTFLTRMGCPRSGAA
jgi:hypothetical protein